MKVHVLAFLFVLSIISLNSFAQNDKTSKTNDPVLLVVAGEKITLSEFLAIYKKNNIKSEALDQKSLEEYLDLFINFKLKVKAAQDEGIDTTKAFRDELNGYRATLAQPYLSDKDVTEKIVAEAYDRLQWDIRASHILVKLATNAPPADTLAAYEKIMKYRKRILKGEDFGKVAAEVSEDPSARDQQGNDMRPAIKGNQGDLGYFSALDMIYPFECAAYNAKLGQVTMPIRTSFGYHILKVTAKKPALGKVLAAHIYLMFPANSTHEDSLKIKQKADEIYQELKNGLSFEEACNRYSDDKGSAAKGGQLPWFGSNRLVPEFIDAVRDLKPGEISKPVLTPFGYHIIKLIEHKPVASFEESKAELRKRVARDSRSQLSRDAAVNEIKKQFGAKEFPKAKKPFYKLVDSSVYNNAWSAEKAKNLNAPLFKIGNVTYTQSQFANYLAENQGLSQNQSLDGFVTKAYKSFIADKCIAYKDSKLEDLYPDFKSLMKEYREGIMLFSMMDQMVWSKAIKDTAGLKEYFEQNKNKYQWGERLEATIYTCKNADILKSVKSMLASGKYSDKNMMDSLNKESQLNLKYEYGKFSRGDNKLIDSIPWVAGKTYEISNSQGKILIVVKQMLQPGPKELAEARGLVTADYQEYLEKQWLAELRKKYPVEVFKDVLKQAK